MEKHVIHITEQLPNVDILNIFSKTDFYILAHRFSIFDFSTIEAMHLGNIPVLTEVGGNKEMITEGNGFFIKEDMRQSAMEFLKWFCSIDVDEYRQRNMEMAYRKFSEEVFLKNYQEIIQLLSNDLSCEIV